MPASTGFLEPDLCMKIKPLVATVIIVLTLLASAQAQKIGKESIRFEDKNRTFYLFVPETSEPSSRMPVIVLLHGSGRNGLSLVERWRDLAKREGVMLAGPDSLNSEEWRTKSDGPDFILQAPFRQYLSRCSNQSTLPRQPFMLDRWRLTWPRLFKGRNAKYRSRSLSVQMMNHSRCQ